LSVDHGPRTTTIPFSRNGEPAADALVCTGLEELDTLLRGDGYPDKSTVLVVGSSGIGKEAFGYWFMATGLASGDYCVYVTRLAVSEVKQDVVAFRVDGKSDPIWISAEGGQERLDINDLVGISTKIKDALRNSGGGQRVRVVMDVLSSLLMLNPPETVYRFLTQLFSEIKQNYDAVVLTTLEEGMHSSQVLAAMQQLFDGVIELRLYEKGLSIVPLLRVVKMRTAYDSHDWESNPWWEHDWMALEAGALAACVPCKPSKQSVPDNEGLFFSTVL
jgi:circadian clock protein KaiC